MTTPKQELGHRQPAPGDPDYETFWRNWVVQWRVQVVERTRRVRDDGGDMRLMIKAHTDACDTCKASNASEVTPYEAPDPPVSACTSPRGCQCTFTSKLFIE